MPVIAPAPVPPVSQSAAIRPALAPSGSAPPGSSPPGRPHKRGTKGSRKKKTEELACDAFADLRSKHPPVDPAQLHNEFSDRKKTPASPPSTPTVQYCSPTGTTDREGRFLWWRELAKIGIFIKQVYAETPYQQYINASAMPGSLGQAVVKAHALECTLLWMESGRLYSPNSKNNFDSLLRVVFEPFDAHAHGSEFAPTNAAAQTQHSPQQLAFSMQ